MSEILAWRWLCTSGLMTDGIGEKSLQGSKLEYFDVDGVCCDIKGFVLSGLSPFAGNKARATGWMGWKRKKATF